MKRRNFIKFASVSTLLFSTNMSFAKSISAKSLLVLEEVYGVLFPKTSTMPSAKEFGAVKFLVQNINHKSFDDEDKTLVLQGTKDFLSSFPNFLELSKTKKQELIFDIVNSNDYAQSWISRLIYYGIEAMLGDPIYGGNSNQVGWNSINHKIGYPRPKLTYGQKV